MVKSHATFNTLTSNLATPTFGTIGETHNSITFRWNTVTNATGYEYRYGTSTPTGAWTTLGNVNSVNLTGLNAGTRYYFQLRATASGYNDSGIASTSGYTDLAAPSGLSIGSITTTGATATFTSVTNGSVYQVEVSATGKATRTFTASSSPIYITGLDSDTTYSARIRANANGNYGLSNYSAAVSFTTLEETLPKLATPIKATSTIGSRSITFKWGAVTNADGYRLTDEDGTTANQSGT